MAELENHPSCLKVIEAISIAMAVIACLTALFGILAMFNESTQAVSYITLAIGAGTSYAILSGFYYVVKAACVYIEKEENQ